MFESMKLYLIGGALALFAGLVAMLLIQESRMNLLKDRLASKEAKLDECVLVNNSNKVAMDSVIYERDRLMAECTGRLDSKDKMIRKLQAIDRLKGGVSNEKKADGGSGSMGGMGTSRFDSLLNALDGMLPGPGDIQNGIRQGEGIPSSDGAPVLSGELGYCLTEMNAKNLLKNVVLLRAWALDMHGVLASYQTITQGGIR